MSFSNKNVVHTPQSTSTARTASRSPVSVYNDSFFDDLDVLPTPHHTTSTNSLSSQRHSSSLLNLSSPHPQESSLHEENHDHLPFNEEFQHLVSLITDERILKEEAAFRKLSRLSRDFRFAAMTFGKVIIVEKHLEYAQKTIKPCEELPGVAGGEKYMCGGILFRFAVDRNHIYGSDELAGKEAAHQLRGLTELVSAGVDGLSFPLMALIDYRGCTFMISCL